MGGLNFKTVVEVFIVRGAATIAISGEDGSDVDGGAKRDTGQFAAVIESVFKNVSEGAATWGDSAVRKNDIGVFNESSGGDLACKVASLSIDINTADKAGHSDKFETVFEANLNSASSDVTVARKGSLDSKKLRNITSSVESAGEVGIVRTGKVGTFEIGDEGKVVGGAEEGRGRVGEKSNLIIKRSNI